MENKKRHRRTKAEMELARELDIIEQPNVRIHLRDKNIEEIDSEEIWKSVLHSYDMSIDYDKRGYDAIITAIKIACDKVLDLAAENVSIIDNKIDKSSILKIKDWIK